MEFDGTTSISQFAAGNPAEAVRLWLAGLAEPSAYGLSQSSAQLLRATFAEDLDNEPVPVDSVANVWCASAVIEEKGLALLNIVKTCLT